MLCKVCFQKGSESDVNTAVDRKRTYAMFFTIISFVIQAVIIILSFTDLFGVSSDYLGLEDKSFGVFDFLNKSIKETDLESLSYWSSFVFFAVVISGIILASIIYFIHKLCSYSFSSVSDDSKKVCFGSEYLVYSTNLPMALSIVSLYTMLCYNSWLPYAVYPSAALWTIIALTIVQIALNRKYTKLTTKQ